MKLRLVPLNPVGFQTEAGVVSHATKARRRFGKVERQPASAVRPRLKRRAGVGRLPPKYVEVPTQPIRVAQFEG